MSASEQERSGLDPSRGQVALSWAVVAVALREIAIAFDDELEEAA